MNLTSATPLSNRLLKMHAVPFPITGRHKIWRRAVREAWAIISYRFTSDAVRLSCTVRSVHIKHMEAGDIGQWKSLHVDPRDPSFVLCDNDRGPGELILNRDNQPTDPLMSVLHELGHAATTYDDLYDRGGPSEEWASEACADFYAAKWGGLDRLCTWDQTRDKSHHGIIPGQEMEVDGRRYRMDENFVYVNVGLGRP